MMSSAGKLQPLGQNSVRALADAHLALDGIGLALLVEGHHHHRGAVAQAQSRMRQERLLAFLQADGIDDALALHAFEARFDHRPFRGVDHDGHARDIRFARDQAQEFHHRGLRVQHALIHVHVDDLRAVRHLLTRHVDRRRVVARFDQLAKLRRSGHVGALADIDEQAAAHRWSRAPSRSSGRPIRCAEATRGARPSTARLMARMCSGVVPQQPPTILTKPLAANSRSVSAVCSARLVVLAERIRQSGIGIGADVDVGDARQLLDIGPKLLAAERAIQSHHQRPGVADGIPKRLRWSAPTTCGRRHR